MTYTATPQSRPEPRPRTNTRPGPRRAASTAVQIESVRFEEHADGERKYNLIVTKADGTTGEERIVGIAVKYLRVLERDERELERRMEILASSRKSDIPGNRDQWIGGAQRKVEATLARIAEALGEIGEGEQAVLEQVGGRDVFMWSAEGVTRPAAEPKPKRKARGQRDAGPRAAR